MKDNRELIERKDTIVHRIIILSGGTDSTLCLLKEVERLKAEHIAPDEHCILAVYFDHANIKNTKRNLEKRAIRNILRKIKKDYGYNIKLQLVKTEIYRLDEYPKTYTNQYINSNYFSGQAILWLSSLLTMLPNIIYKNTEIIMGYNLTDGGSHKIALYIKNTVESLMKSLRAEDEEVNVKVAFPLIFEDSASILEELIIDYPEYYKLCWFCENPKTISPDLKAYKPCCTCSKCREHISQLFSVRQHQIIMDTNTNPEGEDIIKNVEKYVKGL